MATFLFGFVSLFIGADETYIYTKDVVVETSEVSQQGRLIFSASRKMVALLANDFFIAVEGNEVSLDLGDED